MLTRKHFHDAPCHLKHLLFVYAWPVFSVSQPVLTVPLRSEFTVRAETVTPSHSASTSTFPLRDHMKLPLMRPKQTWLKLWLFKLTHLSQLSILIEQQVLFQIRVKFWLVFLFQMCRCSPSFSCWRELASAPENRIVPKRSNKFSKSLRQEEMNVLSNAVHIFSL